MKHLFNLTLMVWFFIGCESDPDFISTANLIEPLRPYVRGVTAELDQIPAERATLLSEIAEKGFSIMDSGEDVNLTFICTHNSRRSHMSQIWAQTAAYYYGLENVKAYSGGTEETACNCRTVAAMRRVGFSMVQTSYTFNPIYLVQYSDDEAPIRAYSKLYNVDENPKEGFIALMTCSAADRSCPIVEGAVARYPIHYMDPKLCDDTPDEPRAYNERCREIAREMFYIMREIRQLRDNSRSLAQMST